MINILKNSKYVQIKKQAIINNWTQDNSLFTSLEKKLICLKKNCIKKLQFK